MNFRVIHLGLCCLLLVSPAANANDKKPPQVEVAQPVERVIVDYVNVGAGHVEAIEHVDLRARVTGYVAKVNFKPGDLVRKGDVLFELDDKPHRVALEIAEARLAVAQAQVNRTKVELDRASQLVPKKAISQEDFEHIKANHVETKAKLIVAVAELQLAKLTFEFTRIVAPIAGTIGAPNVTLGNLVKADDTLLAGIDSVGPVRVGFQLHERDILQARRLLKDAAIPVAMGRAEDTDYPHQGVIDFLDNRVDPKTEGIRCRAKFANADGSLLPGTRVFVRVAVSAPYKALLIDDRVRVKRFIEGRRILVVNDKNIVEWREVELESHGRSWSVKAGLTPADLVIVKGFEGIDAGMKVAPVRVAMQIRDSKAPKKNKTPEKKPESNKLKELLKERHAVLTDAAKITATQFQVGGVPFQAVLQTQRDVLEAGLDLCETPGERIELLRKKLKLVEENYETVKARGRLEKNGALLELQARALVLETQIQLLREEEKAKGNK